jgi:hypothetical protein
MNIDEINKAFDEEYIKYRAAFPKDYKLPKEWAGLTDEEIRKLAKENIFVLNAIIATNAKLKEKNT